jgi:hypothetical protein
MIKNIIMILLLLTFIIGISGCNEKSAVNGTWGEKKISISSIKVSDNTTGDRYELNDSIYYVNGYILNENQYDALNVKIKVTTYDSQDNIVMVKNITRLNPKNIPSNGNSEFYAIFSDPEKRIVKFKVEVLNAQSQY